MGVLEELVLFWHSPIEENAKKNCIAVIEITDGKLLTS